MSVKQNGHGLVLGGAGLSAPVRRLTPFTRRKTANAIITKSTIELRNNPTFSVGAPAALAAAMVGYFFDDRLMKMFEKSTPPSASPIGGIRMSVVNDVTIFWNAAPTVNPTARSITLPLIANCLNSETIDTIAPSLLAGLVRSLRGKDPSYQAIAKAKQSCT